MPKPTPLLWEQLALRYGGRCTLWIDQSDRLSNPADDIASGTYYSRQELLLHLEEILFSRGQPSASEGVCVAVVYDWIRNETVIGHDFVAGFRGADDLYYRARQLKHRLQVFDQKATYDFLKLNRKLLKVAEGIDEISSSSSTRGRVLELRSNLDELEKKFARVRKTLYQPSLGEDILHVGDMSDKITFVSAEQIVSALALPDVQGWILLAIEGGLVKAEGGHAIGFIFWPSSFRMLDPNTGLFEFTDRELMLRFFEEVLFDKIYMWVYGSGRFRVVRYSLYPSLDD